MVVVTTMCAIAVAGVRYVAGDSVVVGVVVCQSR